MRKEIRALHDRLGATSVYVTHDQIEAMTMADHVVVLRAGIIEQQGRPLDLYDKPANKFVAGFIGSPAMNFLPAIVNDNGSVAVDIGNGPFNLAIPVAAPVGTKVLIGIRPEHLTLTTPGEGRFDVSVAFTESTGSTTFVATATTPELMVVDTGRRLVASGDRAGLSFADPYRRPRVRRGDGTALLRCSEP